MEQPGGEFSRQNADLLGQIKTNLLNAIDYYYSASQSVYEFSSYAPPTLQRFIQFFDKSDPTTVANQRKLIVLILENALKHLAKGQKDYGDISSALNLADKDLQKLLAQLRIDYTPNSPYFKSRVKRIIDSQPSGFFAPKPDKAKIVAELLAKFKPILEFYEKLAANIQREDELLNKSSSQISQEVQLVGERKQQIQALIGGSAVPADSPGSREAAINAAQVLTAICQDYHKARV